MQYTIQEAHRLLGDLRTGTNAVDEIGALLDALQKTLGPVIASGW